MIKREDIEKIVLDSIEGTDTFLVDIAVRPGNLIRVFVDDPSGIPLDECVRISRAVESSLDRESEDFDLQVSSPGLDNPLLVLPQYQKNIGRELKVETNEKDKYTGELIEADEEGVKIQAKIRIKEKGAKKSKTEFQLVELKFDDSDDEEDYF